MMRLFVVMFYLNTVACQTGVVPIAQRELYEKEGKTPTIGGKRAIESKSEPGPEIFLKKENTYIAPKEVKNPSGSLFSLNKKSSFLYSQRPRALVGDFIDIEVAVNRKASDTSSPGEQNQAPNAANQSSSNDELLKALPNLAPSNEKAKVPTKIKMQVIRELENGDVILEAKRSSVNDQEAHAIQITSRLPADVKNGQRPISTADLVDVNWTETKNGTLTQRESSLWEDEYTLRWSDFDEARSKNALDLENKRKDLEKVKGRLEERIKNLGKERDAVIKEREKAAKTKMESEQKVNDLSKKLEEREALIEQQKEAIKKQEEAINTLKSPPKDAQK